jgi:phenylalanyl-tRNA synthetase beta chain
VAIRIGDRAIGHAGQLRPAQARAMDISAPVVIAELDLSPCAALPAASRRIRGMARYPAVTRDIAMVLPAEVPQGRVMGILKSADEPLLVNVALFDVFSDPEGVKVPAGHKSLAYSLTYRADDRTLTVDEANAVHTRLKGRLKSELSLAFRE